MFARELFPELLAVIFPSIETLKDFVKSLASGPILPPVAAGSSPIEPLITLTTKSAFSVVFTNVLSTP